MSCSMAPALSVARTSRPPYRRRFSSGARIDGKSARRTSAAGPKSQRRPARRRSRRCRSAGDVHAHALRLREVRGVLRPPRYERRSSRVGERMSSIRARRAPPQARDGGWRRTCDGPGASPVDEDRVHLATRRWRAAFLSSVGRRERLYRGPRPSRRRPMRSRFFRTREKSRMTSLAVSRRS